MEFSDDEQVIDSQDAFLTAGTMAASICNCGPHACQVQVITMATSFRTCPKQEAQWLRQKKKRLAEEAGSGGGGGSGRPRRDAGTQQCPQSGRGNEIIGPAVVRVH